MYSIIRICRKKSRVILNYSSCEVPNHIVADGEVYVLTLVEAGSTYSDDLSVHIEHRTAGASARDRGGELYHINSVDCSEARDYSVGHCVEQTLGAAYRNDPLTSDKIFGTVVNWEGVKAAVYSEDCQVEIAVVLDKAVGEINSFVVFDSDCVFVRLLCDVVICENIAAARNHNSRAASENLEIFGAADFTADTENLND